MPPVTNDQPPGEPARDDDPTRPPPRPVPPPGQISTPDQLPTVEPGEWPAQPPRAVNPVPAPPAVPPPPPPTLPPPPPPPLVGPPAPPPYVPARRSHTWLWVALAAVFVLVVGSAATLAVVQPWDDDRDDTTVAGPGDAAPTPTEDLEDGQAEPPATTAPPTTAPPTTAPPTTPVTGDLDGDGFGDAAAVVDAGRDVERYVLSSTGTSFKVAREPLSTFEDRTWADFDGDGELDQVAWSFQFGGTLTLMSDDLPFGEADLQLQIDERFPFVTLKPGDFDGDGAVDLVAYAATETHQVTLWVLRNEGGRFAEPEEWMRVPHTSYGLTTVLPADFTGDGLADVAVRTAGEMRGRIEARPSLAIALLTSTGSAFDPGPLERPTRFLDGADAVVGDFGDGQPTVLLIGRGRDGVEVERLRRDGDRLARVRRLGLSIGGRPGTVADAVVSDVDGDGVDDVVYTVEPDKGQAYDGFRVLRLRTPDRLRSEVWAATPRCRSRSCSLYFQNSY
jgi:hypothetical protein